jgi:hypothetical protein
MALLRMKLSGHSGVFQSTLEGEGVHEGSEHSHLVGDGSVDPALGREGLTSDEVASADDDADLGAGLVNESNFFGNVA